MTASDASADYKLCLRVAAACGCTISPVRDALNGWATRQAGLRAHVLHELERAGVDLATIPARGGQRKPRAERAQPKPCDACAAKDVELADLRAKLEMHEAPGVSHERAHEHKPGRSARAVRVMTANLERVRDSVPRAWGSPARVPTVRVVDSDGQPITLKPEEATG